MHLGRGRNVLLREGGHLRRRELDPPPALEGHRPWVNRVSELIRVRGLDDGRDLDHGREHDRVQGQVRGDGHRLELIEQRLSAPPPEAAGGWVRIDTRVPQACAPRPWPKCTSA